MSPPIERNQERLARFARDVLREVGVIVEVGARDGRETRGFRTLFPQANIYSFECNPQTLPSCRRVAAELGDVTLIEKAVSDRVGEITFYPIDTERTATGENGGNPGASSLFRASGKYDLEEYVQKEITVATTTLAEFMREQDVPGIDVLWMDIQGAELMALQGLGPRLANVRLIHTEVEFLEIYSGQPLFDDVAAYLARNGFSFAGFTVYAKHSADAVFVNRRYVSAWGLLRALLRNRLLLAKRLTWLRHRLKRRLFGRA